LKKYDKEFKNIVVMEEALEHAFQNLMDKFQDKKYLLSDLKEDDKNLFRVDILDLKENNYRLKKSNTQLEDKVSFLKVSIVEIYEEVAPL
jgi:hypothetical protein